MTKKEKSKYFSKLGKKGARSRKGNSKFMRELVMKRYKKPVDNSLARS